MDSNNGKKNLKMQRNLCLFLLFTGLSLIGVISTSCKPKEKSEVLVIGEIIFLDGDVSLNGASASIGDSARSGDILVTGPESYAEIQFGEAQILRASENTSLTLNGSDSILELDSGALSVIQSKVKKLTLNDTWDVSTPHAVAAVRGTTFYMQVENPDSTYFCLCNGRIDLKDINGGNNLILEASHHRGVRYINRSGSIVTEDAPMIYHTDEDMESLADRIDISIDWESIP